MKLHHTATTLLAATALASMSCVAIAAPQQKIETAVAAQSSVDFEVFLPLRDTAGLAALLEAQQNKKSTSYHQWLTPAQFGAKYGPTAAAMAKAQAALQAAGLQVTQVNTRSLHVSGTAAQANTLLGTTLKNVTWPDGSHNMVAAKVSLPSALAEVGASVPEFADVPNHQTFYQKTGMPVPAARFGPVGPYFYDDLKQAYDYPSYQTKLAPNKRLDGTGVNVAIVISNDASNADVAAAFNFEGFTATTGNPPPTFTTVKVDGGAPYDPNGGGGTFEASLDVQQVLGGAPGVNLSVVSIPDLSDKHIIDAYNTVVNENKWDLVNSSFGECELYYTAAYNNGVDYTPLLMTYHEIFQQGNAQGITFVASSGDSGGLQCLNTAYFKGNPNSQFKAGVSTPAVDPNVTAVGGTNLITTPASNTSLTSNYVGENFNGDPEVPQDPYGTGGVASNGYWGAGGGRGTIFTAPSYQNAIFTSSNMRTVPDVGMQVGGCPFGLSIQPCGPDRSAVVVFFGGGLYGVIGTSVSSPEFVGALALYQEFGGGGRLGNVNVFLYGASASQNLLGGAGAPANAQYYHKNISGFDGYWLNYGEQYNYAVGNGTPDVRKLFGMLTTAPAGDPQTPSNP